MRGLTSREAARRLLAHGPNVLPDTDRPRPLRELAAQFTHTFAIILWVAAGLALLAVLLLVMLGLPALAEVLGGSWPSPRGWALALACPVVLVVVDGIAKHVSRKRSRA